MHMQFTHAQQAIIQHHPVAIFLLRFVLLWSRLVARIRISVRVLFCNFTFYIVDYRFIRKPFASLHAENYTLRSESYCIILFNGV